jgi:hypothetical protein
MPRSGRSIAWSITAACALAFGAGLAAMTFRVSDFNREHHTVRWTAQKVQTRSFQFEGFPPATLTDGPDLPAKGGAASGFATLVLDYAGRQTTIPVKRPPVKDLPNLALYEEWVSVLAINEVTLDTPAPQADAHSVALAGTDKLLIVVRKTPEGYDPESWGSVRRIEWVFDFYRLMPDGTVQAFERRWPRSDRSERRLQRMAAADPASPPADLTDAGELAAWREEVQRSRLLAAIPPLDQRGPEYFAALHVIPKLNVPRYKFNDTAFDIKVLGWTLPVTMTALLVGSVSLVFAIAPTRRGRSTPGAAQAQK